MGEAADTYYIYDYRGYLSFVLPPNYQEEPSLDLHAYQYKYDGRGNCTWKKLPGCEPVSMKYDLSNRMIFLQDGNLRKQGLWELHGYDKLGRQAVTAITTSASDVSKSHVYVEYTGSGNLDGYQLSGASITPKYMLETDFYDDYAFIEKCDANYKSYLRLNVVNALESAFPSNASPNAKGYLTGKKVYLTNGSNRYVLSSLYYGKKERVVQTHTSNLLGGFDDVYTSYTYIGNPLKTKHIHVGRRTIQEIYDYAYDHAGRPTTVSYSITGSAKRVLSSTEYDDYGRISKQNLLGKETVSNTYNIRSWKTGISSENFAEKLAYNKPNDMLSPSTALYNGNISAMSWRTGMDGEKGYRFSYNRQSMLTDADYGEGESLTDNTGRYDESMSYDKMGNVLSLVRYGLRDDNKYGLIDNLSYDYNGNQLRKVDDTVTGPYYAGAFHFVDGAKSPVEYTYDANGNMVQDMNKGISSITYDSNNLPRQIKFADGRTATYTYDAAGNKLSVVYNLTAMTSALPQMSMMQSANAASANATNGQKTVYYCGNVIYDDNETVVMNDIGYALYDKNGALSFHYYLKDHLGDNRVVMNENGTIEQINDYYPTGALMGSSKNGDAQRYKYNGKELDRLNGLDWYDYGARYYDAKIVRWNGMDKLCEKYSPYTPYGYCKNNFMNAYDPDGNNVVILLAPNGARGAGHMAILIQNEEGKWTLWSKNGTPEHMHAYGKEGECGTEHHNNRGGSLDENETSYDTVEEFFNSSDNPRDKGVPEYTEGYMIMTTKEQDKKAKAAVKTELDKDYNVLTSNCAQAVQQGLKSAGLNPGNGILPKKEVYPSIYKNNKGKFILYYNTYKNQYYKVKK